MPRCPKERATALTGLMPDLTRIALKLTRNRAAADDLAQETLLRVWRKLDQGADIDDLRPYLMATARNLSRRPPKPLDPLEESDTPTVSGNADRKLVTDEIVQAISALPDDQARLLKLAASGTMRYSDIAEIDGVPVGTVMSRLSRARARLREKFDLSAGNAVAELLDAID